MLFAPQGGWLFIALAPLTLWTPFRAAILGDRDGEAFRKAVLWAILLSIGLIVFTRLFPERSAENIVRGATYRAEMYTWIETGGGKEGDWHRFLPEHALHLGLFVFLALVSAGYAGLALGAGLMGYMNYFVASAMSGCSRPWETLSAAWFPWSACRVLAYIAFGVLLARPLLRRSGWPYESRHARWFLLATIGLVLDVLLKIFLAPAFRDRLHELVTTAVR